MIVEVLMQSQHQLLFRMYHSAPRLPSAVSFQIGSKPAQSGFTKTRLISGTTSYSTLANTYRNVSTFQGAPKPSEQSIAVERQMSAAPALRKPISSLKRIQSAMPTTAYKLTSEPSHPRIEAEPDSTSQVYSQATRSQKVTVNEHNVNSAEVMKRSKFDPEVRSQVMRVRVSKLSNRNIRNTLTLILVKQRWLLDAIKLRQEHKILDILQELIECAYRTKSVTVLLEMLCFAAFICEQAELIMHSIFLFQQVRSICNYSNRANDNYKLKAFLGFASCAFKDKRYEVTIKLLKKCLQYAWACKNVDVEIDIYDRLSLCYFYLGQLKKSEFYHERSLTYDYELDSSPLKYMAIDILRIFLEKNYPQHYGELITLGLLNKLELPVNNDLINMDVPDYDMPSFTSDPPSRQSMRVSRMLGQRSNSQSPLERNGKGLTSLELDGVDQLNQIILEKEFEFEVYTPKHSFRSEARCFDHLKRPIRPQDIYHNPKLRNNAFNLSELGVVNQLNAPNPIEDSDKYKLPLPRQIEIRLKKVFNYENAIRHAHAFVNMGYHMHRDRIDKIQVNHKNTKRERELRLANDKKRHSELLGALSALIEKLFTL